MLAKIISGGQTGVDRAALDVAIAMGIPHGGWCPKGRRAEDGTIPARYHLAETRSAAYRQRTEWNVRDSEGTVIFTISPVLIGGSMGTGSYILAGMPESEERAFASACHGAGRAMSRHQASRTWQGRGVINELAARGIDIRSPSLRGVAEEAPGAYKDVSLVVDAAQSAGLARKVARLEPVICIKG